MRNKFNFRDIYRKWGQEPRQEKSVRLFYVLPLLGLMYLCSGCVLGQEWSENYALQPGTAASDPSFIDGNMETVGQSQRKKSNIVQAATLDIPSEALVHLPEKRSIYRIVIHSSNLLEFKVQALNSLGEWEEIYDQRTNKERVIDIRLKKVVTTASIKVLVRQTTDDAAARRENLQLDRENRQTPDGSIRRGRIVHKIKGPTTALAKIAEIELYGYATTGSD